MKSVNSWKDYKGGFHAFIKPKGGQYRCLKGYEQMRSSDIRLVG